MKKLSTSTASADACTAPTTALFRLIQDQAFAKSLSADLVKGTWTFEISPLTKVAAGHYALLPIEQVRQAMQADRLADSKVAPC